jgi:hypothetical protein
LRVDQSRTQAADPQLRMGIRKLSKQRLRHRGDRVLGRVVRRGPRR